MKSNDEYFFGSPLDVPGEPLRGSQQTPRPVKKQRRFPLKKLLKVLLIIIMMTLIIFGVWKFFNKNDGTPASEESNIQERSAAAEPETSQALDDIPEATDFKTFQTDHPRISFDYPDTWSVAENDRGVRVESPNFKYMTTEGVDVEGNFRVYIRQQARTSDGEYIGRGLAIEPSQKFTYSQPVVGQLPETNLIHFGLDTTDHFAYFFIAGNYALEKSDTLGPGYGQEAGAYIITGGYTEKALEDDMATHRVSLDYYKDTTAYKQALKIIESLKLL